MDKKLVSVILPVYNGADFLSEALESILYQTYTNFELIIVNDCSIDNSAEIAENYRTNDCHIQIIYNQENKKLTVSLNLDIR